MQKGKLVVIEGTDGAGKGTQLGLLIEYCKTNHVKYGILDFPQYYKTFFGRWIGRFMKGEFGGAKDVPPYIASIPYAADRWQAKEDLELWLAEGKTVFINRYAGSNAVYQSAKLPKSERQDYIDWQFEMEYKVFGIPKEDIVIFLYVPYAVSQQLLATKAARKYMGNNYKKDIHESNTALMLEVEKIYLEFCKKFPYWIKIDCTKNGTILTKDEIHQKILSVLRRKKIIPDQN
jgi:dTMP kinase